MTERQFYVYIFTNATNNVLYVGVTSNLVKRMYQHREKLIEGFTKRYRVSKLVYFEVYENAEAAIQREKQLKAGSRKKKVQLITSKNPLCEDLYETIL